MLVVIIANIIGCESMADVLVVDDEPEIIYLVKMMLEKKGHNVSHAGNGEECLRFLEKAKPDLIVLDVMMPGLKGWDVCKRIKESKENSSIPVILLTVRTSNDSVKKSYEYAHCDAHINKPFEMKEFLATVDKLLNENRK